MRVKVFNENDVHLETMINEWLITEKPDVKQMTSSSSDVYTTVIFLYSDNVHAVKNFTEEIGPECPECFTYMVKRFRHADNKSFWRCPHFPQCRSVIDIDDETKKGCDKKDFSF